MPIQRKGMRALQIWCSRVTSEYSSVNVVDLTSSFRDGLAFVGIIHHFRPDLVDSPDTLDKSQVFENNSLAFRVAEDKLDVPALLDPQDMADGDEPDKFSVVTYVSQFYHLFKDADDSRSSPSLVGRTLLRCSESENDSLISHSSDSECGTPLGTPKTPAKTAVRPFNQAELIAKYGEEIFSTSSSEKKNKVGSLCSDFEAKAKLVDAAKRQT